MKPRVRVPRRPIGELVDAAVAALIEEGLEPRTVYLTPTDYDRLQQQETERWRKATGSSAILWPLSAGDSLVPIINEKLIPVRPTYNGRMRSTVYASNGRGVPLDLP